MVLARRWLIVASLSFWQGGFAFYSAIVVPIGTTVLESARLQGFITQQVTESLNLAGMAAAAFLLWELAAARQERRRRLVQALLTAVLVVTLALLFWIHPRMDAQLDRETFEVLDAKKFYRWHRAYLLVSTVQWGASLLLGLCLLRGWQQQDRRNA